MLVYSKTIYKDTIRVLLVNNNEQDYILTKHLLTEIPNTQFKVDWVSGVEMALVALESKQHDVYLIDNKLGNKSGIDFLQLANKMDCRIPIIILTGKDDQKIDIEAMKSGAADYLVKDKIDSFILERSIRYAVERAQTLEAIKESESKYRNIFEKSIDVIFLADKNGRFLDINPSATRLLGYEREELLSMNFYQLLAHEFDKKTILSNLQSNGEVTLLNQSGDKIFCLLTMSVQPSQDGNSGSYQGILHDITHRKKAEQKLINTEKLAVTGRIAHTIAHEVRNPLTNVILSLEQLKNECEPLNGSVDIYFEIIRRNCERINQLIIELLNSSKPSSLLLTNYPVNRLLDESLEMAGDRISLRGIKVEKDYSSNMKDIALDTVKIKTAFLNIILNAIEAMDHTKGVLKLKTELKDKRCLITISDNGSGISNDILNKLFEPFYTSKPNGIGLGLTTAQNIIFNHKGTIDIESEVGKGTRFIIGFDLN